MAKYIFIKKNDYFSNLNQIGVCAKKENIYALSSAETMFDWK